MAIEVGRSRDLRSVQDSTGRSRQTRVDFDANRAQKSANSEAPKRASGLDVVLDLQDGRSRKINAASARVAEQYGMGSVKDRVLEARVARDADTSTMRGGGWKFTAPEDVVALGKQGAPFPLSEELDPVQDPFELVDAAVKLASEEIRMDSGLATMVQANIAPAQAYRLLAG